MLDKGLLIKAKQGISPNKVINNCCVLCRDKTIYAVGGKSAFKNAHYSQEIEIPDSYIIPGLIDSHIYGFKGHSFINGKKSLEAISKELVKHGVTTFVPTAKARNLDKELTFLQSLAEAEFYDYQYSEPIGIHLVGPFINRSFKSDFRDDGIREEVDMDELKQIVEISKGKMKLMTFAPEIKGNDKLIKFLLENNIKPSMGYSAATDSDVYNSVKNGCKRTTHLYNAMAPLHQRIPGLISTSLIDGNVCVELIIDGFHVAPQMVNLACQIKLSRNIIAVSAATEAAMLPQGDYVFDNQEVSIVNDLCVLKNGGKILGSIVGLDIGWQNILKFTNSNYLANGKTSISEDVFSLNNLQQMSKSICYFTSSPASDLGLEDRGYLSPGLLADLVVLNKKHQVEATIKKGKIVYLRNPQYLKTKSSVND